MDKPSWRRTRCTGSRYSLRESTSSATAPPAGRGSARILTHPFRLPLRVPFLPASGSGQRSTLPCGPSQRSTVPAVPVSAMSEPHCSYSHVKVALRLRCTRCPRSHVGFASAADTPDTTRGARWQSAARDPESRRTRLVSIAQTRAHLQRGNMRRAVTTPALGVTMIFNFISRIAKFGVCSLYVYM